LSNVVMEDARDGAHYVCVVENEELRAIVEGDDQKITPRRITGDHQLAPALHSTKYPYVHAPISCALASYP